MKRIEFKSLVLVLFVISPLFFAVIIPTGKSLETSTPNEDLTNGLPVCTAINDQYSPQISLDETGEYAFITWTDNRSGTNYDIYAQKLSLSGDIYWTDGTPVCTSILDEFSPQICAAEYGVTITWSLAIDGSNNDIYAKTINSIPTPLPTVEICNAINSQRASQICTDGTGGVIIAWKDQRANGFADIYAQRTNSDGLRYWPHNGREVSTAPNNQYTLRICSDGVGGAIITWEDDRSGHKDIYTQRINSSGFQQWIPDGTALCTTFGWQTIPQICTDGAEGAIITWQDERSGSDNDIYAQGINSTGNEQWTSNGIAICTANNDQLTPQICSDGMGGAIITWEDDRYGYDIYAQKVNSIGDVQWTFNGTAICIAGRSQYRNQICSDGVGGAIITWQDGREQLDHNIYAQRVDSSGNVKWISNGIPVCTAKDYQLYPQICSDGAGGAIITWMDLRNGSSYDIYAERIDSNGNRLWSTLEEDGSIQFGT